jgi:protease secretion system membrane fusion protein
VKSEIRVQQPATGNPKSSRSGLVAKWIDAMNPYDPDRLRRDGLEPIRFEETRMKSKAVRLFFIAFVAFAVWATFAPIDSGVNVKGTVVVKGNRKAVQHPSGGVVETIMVREGSVVAQGDPLIRINRLSTEAGLNAAELEFIKEMATESRLTAERENLPAIKWLPGLEGEAKDARIREVKAQQVQLFNSRRAEINGQQKILQEQIAGLTTQAVEMQKVLTERKQQLTVMAEDSKNHIALAAEGYLPRVRANEVERARSDLLASIATTMSEIGKTQSSIAATRLQLIQSLAVYRRDIETQLAESQKNRGAMRAKVDSLRFDMSLTELRAPVSGTVVGLKVNTIGGVIEGGGVLMEIVPNEGTLIVDAQVPPELIDKVRVGLQADMRFTAFNHNTTPVIPGSVRLVGADRLAGTTKDQPTEYYLAQIETTDEGYQLLGRNHVQPGMPVEVVIKTGERSFMSYLLKPLSDRFAKSFKEN